MKTFSVLTAALMMGLMITPATDAAPEKSPVFSLDGIEHSPATPLPGQDLMFYCYAQETTEATLVYRNASGEGFSMLPMVPVSDKAPLIPSYSVPLSGTGYADGDFIEYYVAVTDGFDVLKDPADAPTTLHRVDFVFANEALGIYFDEIISSEKIPFSPTAYITNDIDELVTGSLAIRNPHIWEPEKGIAAAEQWDCQVRIVGNLTDVTWTISNDLVNSAGAPVSVDSTVTYAFNVSAVPKKSEPSSDELSTFTLATFSCRVPTIGTQVQFYIEPWDDISAHFPDSPGYSPDGIIWRTLGTSSGFDPNDPTTDYGDPCAVINLAQPIADTPMTWSDVKTLYR